MQTFELLDRPRTEFDAADRRRPGRAHVPSNLLPMLRNPGADGILPDDMSEDWAPRHPIAPSRGIALALALCTPIWLVIGGLLSLIIR